MRKIISAILLLALIGQTFNQGFYYLDYLVDKSVYAKDCINKARPMLHCDGKCQLMKKIQESEKKNQQQAPELKLASKAEVLSSRSSFAVLKPVAMIVLQRHYFPANAGDPVDQPSSFFHPPNV